MYIYKKIDTIIYYIIIMSNDIRNKRKTSMYIFKEVDESVYEIITFF